jgi:hypothetical protein
MRMRCLALALALGALPRSAAADEDPKQACIAAYTDGQRARKRAALKEAHEKLLVCARDPCPQVLRPECLQWLSDVEQRLPSVVLEARDAEGHDLSAVRVTIDGTLATDKLDGKAIDLDPGEHALHFEAEGGRTADEKIVLAEGEKRRRVSAVLGGAPKVSLRIPKTVPPPQPQRPQGVTWPVIGLGALGALGLGGFAFFGLSGTSKQSELDASCRPACAPSQVDEVRHTYLAADISLLVGVAAIGAAVVFYLTQSHPQPASSSAAVR